MKKCLSLFLCALLLAALTPAAAAIESSAQSYALMEKSTGTLILAHNEHEKLEPASVTKVMTLLLVMEAIDDGRLHYGDLLSASEHAASMGGSQVYLKAGEQMTVEDLIKAVCLASGNDAAVCLAEAVAGSEESFAARMNERAAELTMADTHFVNCTGLPAEGHVTSAYDIALMSRELILNHPDIRRFTTVWMDSLRNGTFQLANTNKLIRFYDGATGLKTGSTDAALYCLSATAERDGMELIATVLKAPTSKERFRTAESLLSYGFANFTLVDALPQEPLPTVPVKLGVRESVRLRVEGAPQILLEKTKVSALSSAVETAPRAQAPVAAGDRLGSLTLSADGETLAAFPLVAQENVKALSYWDIYQKILIESLFVARI